MRISARLFALLWLLAVPGCAGPDAREQDWLEVRSANFSIYTALAEREARDLIENLELFRAAILAMTKVQSVHPHVPTEIYAFRSESDFRVFEPHQNAVGFFRPTLRVNYVALFAGSRAREARATLYHEYTHFLLQNEGAAYLPLWFDEGLAELLSSFDVSGDAVRIGDPPEHRVSWLRSGSPIPYSRVIRARSYEGFSEDELPRFYAQSWLLVHHLVLRSDAADFATQMRQYIERIGRRVDPEQAFRESFGTPVRDLAALLEKYAEQPPVREIARGRLDPELGVAVRVVPPDEIDTRLAWLALNGAQDQLARQHLERALTANPNNARAIAGIGEVYKLERRWADAEAAYQRSLELAPENWQNHLEFGEYWLMRALLNYDQRAEHVALAREQLARATELAPEIPEGHAMLGSTYLVKYPSNDKPWEDQPPEPGIEALERAAKLLPSHPEIDYPLARLYLMAGNRERATELLRRVVHGTHGGAGPQAALLLDVLEGRAPDPAAGS